MLTLATAYWSVLVAALLPYLWVTIAKASGERYDNRDPRAWLSRQSNPRVHRANAAHANAFEAFPAFAAAILLSQLASVPEAHIATLAVAFVAFRVLHGLVYTFGHPHWLRTLAWLGGFSCVLVLLAQAALRIGTAAGPTTV